MRNRLFAGAGLAAAVSVFVVAFAQQPPPNVSRGPSAPPAQSVKPPTQQLGNATVNNPAAAWADVQQKARTNEAAMNCRGPLTLEIKANDQYKAAAGSYLVLSFKEAAGATSIQAGECWRTGGFQFGEGNLNRGLKKGDIAWPVDVKQCPLFKSMKFEGGKITAWQPNESVITDQMMRAATQSGPTTFSTKWLNFNGPGGMADGWGHYIAVVGDALTPAVPGCRG